MARVPMLFLIYMVCIKSSVQGTLDSFLKIVENGTPSNTSFINEDVPEECERLGFCETSKRYPVTLATKLIRELQKANITLDRDYEELVKNSLSSFGSGGEDLCSYSLNKVVVPLMIRDINRIWYYTVNSESNPSQTFYVRVCSKKNAVGSDKCTTQLTLESDYESQCIQKYMYRRTIVIRSGDAYPISAEIPSCCACVATLK